MRHIAERKIAFPPNIDCLLCEQEVKAGRMSAVDVVLASDAERVALIAKEKALLAKLDEKHEEKVQVGACAPVATNTGCQPHIL